MFSFEGALGGGDPGRLDHARRHARDVRVVAGCDAAADLAVGDRVAVRLGDRLATGCGVSIPFSV
jgi:hypothetical protein